MNKKYSDMIQWAMAKDYCISLHFKNGLCEGVISHPSWHDYTILPQWTMNTDEEIYEKIWEYFYN